MIDFFVTLFCHSIILEITGGDIDRFFNLCKNNGVLLKCLKPSGAGYTASMRYKQWELLHTFEDKCQVTCKIIKETGLVPFFKKYKKRVAFFAFLLLFLFLIFYSSRFVWHIEVEGESVYTDEEVIRYVQEELVPLGTKRKSIRIAELEKNLREHYDKIAWITCELDGTRLIVRFVETVSKEEIRKSEEPCNIVALKDGLVTELIATSGKKLANPGDEVKKGDILITGVVHVYNEYEELIETNYVAADGIVYGQTKYDYSMTFPMDYTEKKLGKKKKTGFRLCIGSDVYSIFSPKDTDTMEMVESVHSLHIGSSYYLPVSLVVNRYYRPEYETKTYTEEEARAKQEKLLQNYMNDLKKKGVEILENNVTIEFGNNECKASGTLIVKEIIGVPETFVVQEQIQEQLENEEQ